MPDLTSAAVGDRLVLVPTAVRTPRTLPSSIYPDVVVTRVARVWADVDSVSADGRPGYSVGRFRRENGALDGGQYVSPGIVYTVDQYADLVRGRVVADKLMERHRIALYSDRYTADQLAAVLAILDGETTP